MHSAIVFEGESLRALEDSDILILEIKEKAE